MSDKAQEILVDQKVNTSIDFPNYIATGVYYKLTERWGMEADYLWFNWSVFDEINLDFENDDLNQTVPEEYQDSWQIRLGTHYELTEALSLRAGYALDKTPQPIQSVSPLLPDDTRDIFSLGGGYNFGKYQIDAGYMLVYLGERSTVENGDGQNHYGFDGTYKSRADLFYASFGINF
jgi:long-chain fatty acid transport protein